MWHWGFARWGIDTWGGQRETVRILEGPNQNNGLNPTAFLRHAQDAILLVFPAGEDVGLLERDVIADQSEAIAVSGAVDRATFGRFDQIAFDVPEVSEGSFREAMESFAADAIDGGQFAFGFDVTDQVFTALLAGVNVGDTSLLLEQTEGIVQGREYKLRRDLLGANATKNLAPNGGFNTDLSGVSPTVSNIFQDTVTTFEGAASVRVETTGASGGLFEDLSPIPARLGFFTFSARVLAPAGEAMKLQMDILEDGVNRSVIETFTGDGNWQRIVLKTLIPNKVVTLIRSLIFATNSGITFWVDEFQVQQHVTPTAFSDSGLTGFSASASYQEESVTVKEVVQDVGVLLASPLKHSYKIRDVFKSRRFWPRLELTERDIVTQKIVTADFRVTAREVPA